MGHRRQAAPRRGGSGRATAHRSFTLHIPVPHVDPLTDHHLAAPSPRSPAPEDATPAAPARAASPGSPALHAVLRDAPLPPTPTLLPSAGAAPLLSVLEDGTLRHAAGPAPLPRLIRRTLSLGAPPGEENLNPGTGLSTTPRGLPPPPPYALPVPPTDAFRRFSAVPPPPPSPSQMLFQGGLGATPVVISRVVRAPMLDLTGTTGAGEAPPPPSDLPTVRRSRLVRSVHGTFHPDAVPAGTRTVDGGTQTTPDAAPGHRHMAIQMTPEPEAAEGIDALVAQLDLEEVRASGRESDAFEMPPLEHVTLRMPHVAMAARQGAGRHPLPVWQGIGMEASVPRVQHPRWKFRDRSFGTFRILQPPTYNLQPHNVPPLSNPTGYPGPPALAPAVDRGAGAHGPGLHAALPARQLAPTLAATHPLLWARGGGYGGEAEGSRSCLVPALLYSSSIHRPCP